MFPLRLHMLFIVVLCAAALLAGCDIGPITLPGINQAPTANAGADQTVEVGERVELNGLGSTDPDDDPLTYTWEQRSGPNVTLDNPNSAQASFLPAEDGFYEFALTVTDGRGGSDTSVVRVFVGDVDPETCPRADAGVDQTVNEGGAVTLRGCNSADPAGGPLDYEWFQVSGAQVSINGLFVCEPAFAAPQVTGADIELEFELTVCNEQGCCDTDAVVITVRDRDPDDPCQDVVCADDGQFCNGVESCSGGVCVSSGDPCSPGGTCDEDNEANDSEAPGPCATPAIARAVWSKHLDNPVLDLGPAGAWDDTRLSPGEVIVENGIYRLWYTGWDGTSDPDINFQVGLATSPDGIHWTREASDPVLTVGGDGEWDSWNVANPALVKDGDLYKMWYSGGDGSIRGIGYAESQDGVHWTKHDGNPVLGQGAPGSWDSWSSFWCSVIKDESEYKMWYSGGASFTSHRIGYATSPDGINWTKYAGNPVLEPECSATWEDVQLWFPHVIKDGLRFHMWYAGYDGSTNRIGYAWSDDGISWEAHCDPVLDVGGLEEWDEQSVLVPRMLKLGDTWRMWYQGVAAGENERGRIGLAVTSTPPSVCDEASDACVACFSANDCDDGEFCNGVETCVGGACLEGESPCGDDETCDEITGCEPLDCADPDFNVETYAELGLPSGMSFDPQGNLFVGSGGAGIDPSPVYKVPPGGMAETYGAQLIPDPDSVIVDATGIVSEPGSVLVGGLGSVYAILPTPPHSVVVVLSGLTNINALALDSRGRLLMLDQDVGVYWSTGDQPVLLFSDVSNTMAIDANDLIYTGGLDGVIRVHDADGNLIDGAFATGLGQYPPVEIGRGGAWGTDVYSIDAGSGELLRIRASGTRTVIGTDFFLVGDLEFGPDDALYVGDSENDRILRVAPACAPIDCTPVTTRVIDGVTVEISTAGGLDMTARTYNEATCKAFDGHEGVSNAPLNPGNVSGTRFISSVLFYEMSFPEAEPIIFEFDVPVTLFGLTTLDLLENGPTCNPAGAHLALRAYDASGVVVDEHTRVGGQDSSGLDLDWYVSGNQIVRVELTGGDVGDCRGYGIDDLVLTASPSVDDLEDIGPDCTPVTSRIIDGVTVEISTSLGGADLTAHTYNDDACFGFFGDNGEVNAPLNPDNVSGTRFISSVGAGTGLGFSDTQPIIFEFDAPVTLFGLTTLDLLEDGAGCNPGGSSLTLRAYDTSGVLVDEHTRVGAQGPSGLDLDWFVSGSQIVRVELTGGSFGDCNGYGIDNLVLTASPAVDDLEDIGPAGAD